MKIWLLDDRVLFPTVFLGGLARQALNAAFPAIRVHDVASRSVNGVVLSVTAGGHSMPLGARWSHENGALALVSSFHRQVVQPDRITRGDDRKAFLEVEPSTRLRLRTSARAFARCAELAISSQRMSPKEADRYMRYVHERAEELGLAEAFCLVDAHGRESHVSPLPDATDGRWRSNAEPVLSLPAPRAA